MEFGKMKRNTSNWSNFCMLLLRAGFTASAGLSCFDMVGWWWKGIWSVNYSAPTNRKQHVLIGRLLRNQFDFELAPK